LKKKLSEKVGEKGKQPDKLSKQPTHPQDGPTSLGRHQSDHIQ